MPNYRIDIEYDGSQFVGWQRQANGSSIQALLEESLQRLTSEKAAVFGAGRTDAGVHAFGQVATFKISKDISTDIIRDGLNQHLRPHPISILFATIVGEDFHARFSAKLRTYEYKIINRRSPLTIAHNRAWCVHKKLNYEKMLNESLFFIASLKLQ